MKIFELFGEVAVKSDGAKSNLDDIQKKGQETDESLEQSFDNINTSAIAMGAGILAAGAALAGLVTNASETANEINKFSQVTGTSTDEFQRWDAVLKSTGYSMEQASGDLAALGEKAMDAANGVGEGAELFAALGVEVTDVGGKLKSQGQIFNETIAALQEMEDVTQRNAIASALLSTTGEELVPVLNMTNEELQAMKDNAEVIGEDDLKSAEEFRQAFEEVQQVFGKVLATLGISLMPMLTRMADFFVDNMPIIESITTAVFTTIGASIEAVSMVIGGVIDAVGSLVRAIGGAFESFGGITDSVVNDYSRQRQAINEQISALEEEKNAKIDGVRKQREEAKKAHDAEMDEKKSELEAEKNKLKEELDSIQDYSKDAQKQYKELSEARIETIEKEFKEFEKSKKEELKLLDEEFDKKVRLLDDEAREEIEKREAEIKQLEEITAKEEAEIQARKDAERLAELENAVIVAETIEEREEAEKRLTEFLEEQERDRVLAAREAREEELENQIDLIEQGVENAKEKWEEELEAQKSVIEQEISERELLKNESIRLERETLAEQLEMIQNNSNARKSILQSEIESIDDAIVEMSEGLSEGFESEFLSMIENIEEEYSDMIDTLIEENERLAEEEEEYRKSILPSAEAVQESTKAFESGGLGASLGSFIDNLDQRANGGPVSANTPYIVGERGPELIVPGSDGFVVPNESLGGTNITINVASVRNDDDISAIEEAVNRALFNMQRTQARGVGV